MSEKMAPNPSFPAVATCASPGGLSVTSVTLPGLALIWLFNPMLCYRSVNVIGLLGIHPFRLTSCNPLYVKLLTSCLSNFLSNLSLVQLVSCQTRFLLVELPAFKPLAIHPLGCSSSLFVMLS